MSASIDTTVPGHFAGPQSNYMSSYQPIYRGDDLANLGWQLAHDWSQELEARSTSNLTARNFGTLLSAVRSGLPVSIGRISTTNGVRFRETRTYLVHDLIVTGSNSDRLRVSAWGGFGFDMYLNSIDSIATPATTTERLD